MNIVVAGGSGFLGQAVVRSWRRDGHEVKVLTRRARGADDIQWRPDDGKPAAWASALERADAVVNLAGEGIADRRWTAARKSAILNSRVLPTRALADAIRACANPPKTFLSASGVGFYGTRGDQELTESAPHGSDFLSAVCEAWENEANAAAAVSRVVLLRTGLVLARDGGALARMALPFHFFAGGRLGSGQQYLAWIHLEDYVEMVQWSLANTSVSGPLNVTSPNPVTNDEFTRELAKALHRPALFPVPAFALRILLGREMAEALLLEGQRAVPAKAEQLGYQFRFRTVDSAFRSIYP